MNFITFEQAKLLKKAGFNLHTYHCITKYSSDFIYDGDPNHPESHKKGETRIYEMSWLPDPSKNTYPMITDISCMDWLRSAKNIFIEIIMKNVDKWRYSIKSYDTADKPTYQYIINDVFSSYDECISAAITKGLTLCT